MTQAEAPIAQVIRTMWTSPSTFLNSGTFMSVGSTSLSFGIAGWDYWRVAREGRRLRLLQQCVRTALRHVRLRGYFMELLSALPLKVRFFFHPCTCGAQSSSSLRRRFFNIFAYGPFLQFTKGPGPSRDREEMAMASLRLLPLIRGTPCTRRCPFLSQFVFFCGPAGHNREGAVERQLLARTQGQCSCNF